MSAKYRRKGGQKDKREHHGKIFDDQPTDSDAAHGGIDKVALLQRLQKHHRARHRKAKPEHDALANAPAPQMAEAHAHDRRDGDLTNRANYGNAAHGKQVGSREVQPDAKHQQDDADFGELARHTRVGDETRREGADENAGDKIADERRQPQPVGDIAEDRRQHEADGDRRDKVYIMRQGFDLESLPPFCRRKYR